MSESHPTAEFRQHYRANVSRAYNGWVHLSSVIVISLITAAYCFSQIEQLNMAELWIIPLGILTYNFVEYASHRWAGHKKMALTKLFYKRHTGDHHSFFSAPLLSFDSPKDWRIVLFPTYLTVFQAFIVAPVFGYICAQWISLNAAYVIAATMILNHLAYELLHVGYHLPTQHWLHKIPIFRELAHLHRIHHHRTLMKTHNFNLTFPLFDLLLRTFRWIPLDIFDEQPKTILNKK